MAKFAIKALVVTALVCLVFDLAASDESHQHHETVGGVHQQHEAGDKDTAETTPTPSTFKDKFKGFVSSVKEGASDALEKLDEKRKEAVAGTKKAVNGAIDKIKNTYNSFKKGDESSEEVPRLPDSVEEYIKNHPNEFKDLGVKDDTVDTTKDAVNKAKDAVNKAKDAVNKAKDAVVDKTQDFMKSEKQN